MEFSCSAGCEIRCAAAVRASARRGSLCRKGKASKAGAIIALHCAGRPVWTTRDLPALAREGFMKNPIVYRAVPMVAEAAASVPWLLYEGPPRSKPSAAVVLSAQSAPLGRRVPGGALRQSARFRQRLCRIASSTRRSGEFYALRPDRMRIVPGAMAGPRPLFMRRSGTPLRFALVGEGGSRRSCTSASSIRSTITTAFRRWRPRSRPRHAQCR